MTNSLPAPRRIAALCLATACASILAPNARAQTAGAHAQTAPATQTPMVAPLQAQTPIAVPGGTGRFDLLDVDGANNRLLITHGGNQSLDVFDLTSGELIKQIPTGGANGVAVDAKDGKYYVGAGDANSVAVIDSKSLEVSKTIPLGGPVDAMAFDTKRGIVYAGHDDGTHVWAIDAATDELIETIAVPEGPEIVEYDPQTDRVYQNIKSQALMLVIDPQTRAIASRVDTSPAGAPHGLAIDFAAGHLFTVGSGHLVEVDLKTGQVIAQVEVAARVDQIAFDPTRKRIYCAGNGVLSVAQETADGLQSLGETPTARGCHSVTVDPKTGAVWVAYGGKNGGEIMKLTPTD